MDIIFSSRANYTKTKTTARFMLLYCLLSHLYNLACPDQQNDWVTVFYLLSMDKTITRNQAPAYMDY